MSVYIGLGYLHIIKNQKINAREFESYGYDTVTNSRNESIEGIAIHNIFNMTSSYSIAWPMMSRNEKYIVFCIDHFVKYWGEFLKRSDAKLDVQYDTIKHIYDTAVSKFVDTPSASSSSSSSSNKDTSTKSNVNNKKSKSGKVSK